VALYFGLTKQASAGAASAFERTHVGAQGLNGRLGREREGGVGDVREWREVVGLARVVRVRGVLRSLERRCKRGGGYRVEAKSYKRAAPDVLISLKFQSSGPEVIGENICRN